MQEIIHESIKGYNLPFTILLGVILIYWIIALLGVVDIDIGGADMDVDLDLDTDVDGDLANSSAEGTNGNFLDAAMRIVGLSDAPLMFVISVYIIMLWVCNLVANMYFNESSSGGRASLLLVPVVIIAFAVTRLLIRPLRPVMKIIREKEPDAPVIGEQATVISSRLTDEFGRIEVDFEGKKLLLRAVASEGSKELEKGDSVLVVSKIEESNTYIVRPL